MEKAKYQISKSQFFFIAVFYIFADDIIRGIYAQKLKQDIWISIIVSALLSVIILACYFLLYKTSNKGEFAAIIKENVGRPIAFVLFVLYGFYFAFLTFLGLRDIAEVITIFMIHDFPVYVAGIAILAVVIYGLYHGIEAFARTTSILFFVHLVIFVFFSGLILISNRSHFEYFLPIAENGLIPFIKPTLQSAYAAPFGKLFVLLIIYQFVLEKEKSYRYGYYAILYTGLLLLLISVYNIIILGPEAMILDIRPSLRISKRIDIVFFIQRLDILVINSLIMMSFVKVWVLLFGARYLLADAFKIKNGNKIPFVLSILIVIALMFFAKNYITFLDFRQTIIIPYVNLTFEIIIPFLLIIIAIIRKIIRIMKAPARRENILTQSE
ncbi:MAG TPA: endospore germination permease [Bacilli bacterium]|nr:endospore germination permease [Bacilli bacterium]HPZ26884.1 endospore germination permease [Bacilli bacterium]HQC89290.1 endospore germination permease [Bacilli bacterium]